MAPRGFLCIQLRCGRGRSHTQLRAYSASDERGQGGETTKEYVAELFVATYKAYIMYSCLISIQNGSTTHVSSSKQQSGSVLSKTAIFPKKERKKHESSNESARG